MIGPIYFIEVIQTIGLLLLDSRRSSNMFLLLTFFVSTCLIVNSNSAQSNHPKLILISMDSLAYDFLENAPPGSTANFQYFMQNGVLLKRLLNVIPTFTYPNHYSMLTGLYPESHGLVGNYFYDSNLNEIFISTNIADNLDTKWYDVGAEPIYVTNTKAGGGRRSGTVLFPTSLATVKGVAPDVMVENDGTYAPYSPGNYENKYPYVNMSYTDRVERLISWFTDPQRPINLGLLYFPEPDELAHLHGPDSDEVMNVITGPLNSALGYLLQKLEENNLSDSTNILLTADHGHTKRRGFIHLDDYVNPATYTAVGFTGLMPVGGFEDEIIRNMSGVSGIRVYKRDSEELRAMHYSNNNRIPPLIIIPDMGLVVVRNQLEEEAIKAVTVGLHGYDPVRYPEMRPVFMAMGPAFKKNYESAETFSILDLYPLMCHLLDLDPAPNNGSLDNVRHLLEKYTNGQEQTVISVTMLFGGLFMLALL